MATAENRLAHGNQDASVHFWDLPKRRELEMHGYGTKVRELAWRADGRLLAAGGGTTVTVWDFVGKGFRGSSPIDLVVLWNPTRSRQPLASADLPAVAKACAWSPDGTRLAVEAADGTIAIYALDSFERRA